MAERVILEKNQALMRQALSHWDFRLKVSKSCVVLGKNCPKIWNTLFHTILAKILLFMQLFLKVFGGMTNNVDPDQTAP